MKDLEQFSLKYPLDIQFFAEPEGDDPANDPNDLANDKEAEAKYSDKDLNDRLAAATGKERAKILKSLGYETEEDLKKDIEAHKEYLKTKKSAEELANDAKSDAEAKRDEALKELEGYKQKEIMTQAGVDPAFFDFVSFKASKEVNEKVDFKKSLDVFLKENPKYLAESDEDEESDPIAKSMKSSLELQNKKKKSATPISAADIINQMKKGKK